MANLTFEAGIEPPLPTPGHVRLYVDEADYHLKQVDDNGLIIDLTAAAIDLRFNAINNTANTLFKGTVVHYQSWDDTAALPEMVKAKADDIDRMPAIGVVIQDIPMGSTGYVLFQGVLSDVNTAGFTEGQTIYVSNIDGQFTVTRPMGGSTYIQPLGTIGRVNATTGTIVVHSAMEVNGLPNIAENQLWIGDADGYPTTIDRSELNGNSPTTGLITGGALTINADPAKFNIAAGNGTHTSYADPNNPVFTEVSWNAFTGLTPVGLGSQLYSAVGIDINGQVVQLAGQNFSPSARRNIITLGGVIHENLTTISSINNSPVLNYNVVHGLIDYVQALGGIVNGSDVVLSNANLTFSQNAGTFTLPYINAQADPNAPSTKTNAAANPKPFTYSYRNGAGGFTNTASTSNVVPGSYDDGDGTLGNVSNNSWTFQPVYFFGTLNLISIVYGQKTYSNETDAVVGIQTEFSSMVINPTITINGKLLGFLVLKGNATDLSNISQADFVDALQGTSGGASGSTTYDGLTDTPPSKIGFENQHVTVDAVAGSLTYVKPSVMNSRGNAEPAITGIYSGGLLTQNGTTQVDIQAGSGQIVNFYTNYLAPTLTPVSWANQTLLVPNLSTQVASYFYLNDASGVVKQQSGKPTALDRRTKIFLGVVYVNTTTSQISAVLPIPSVIGNASEMLVDQFSFIDPVSKGGIISQTGNVGVNGAMALACEEQNIFFPNSNWQTSKTNPNVKNYPPLDPIQWSYGIRTGAITSVTTLVNPTQWDNNGVLELVPTQANGVRTTIQYVYRFVTGGFVILYGQTVYDNINAATEALATDLETFIIPEIVDEYGSLTAAIIIEQKTTDLADAIIRQVRYQSSGGGGGGGVPEAPEDGTPYVRQDANWVPETVAPVDSVNTQTGIVVLDADDIDDTTTVNKFTTAAEISKLAGIEAGAQVNVVNEAPITGQPYARQDAAWINIGPPAQITNLAATSGGVAQSNLTWTIPSSGTPITSYNCQFKLASESVWLSFVGIDVGAASQIIFGLIAAQYNFRIAAVNANGAADWSNTASGTPVALSGTQQGLFNEVGLNGSGAAMTWTNLGGQPSWSMTSTFGPTPANLTVVKTKGKNHIRTAGLAGLQSTAPALIAQPYTHFYSFVPQNLSPTESRLLGRDGTGTITDCSLNSDTANMYSGTELSLLNAVPTDGTEVIVVAQFNGATSNIRMILNNGTTDVNITGDAGVDGFNLSAFLWDVAQPVDRDFIGDFHEFRLRSGALPAATINSIVGDLKQRWWAGQPYKGDPEPDIGGDIKIGAGIQTVMLAQAVQSNGMTGGVVNGIAFYISERSLITGLTINVANSATGNFYAGIYQPTTGANYNLLTKGVLAITGQSNVFLNIPFTTQVLLERGVYIIALLTPQTGGANPTLWNQPVTNNAIRHAFTSLQTNLNDLPTVITRQNTLSNLFWAGIY